MGYGQAVKAPGFDPDNASSNLDAYNDFNIGVNLVVPLYTGGNISSQTKQAEFAYVAASQDLEKTYRSVVKDVRAYNNNISASIGALRAYEQSVISAKSALEATEAVLEAYGLMKHPKLTYQRAKQRSGKKGSFTNPLADCYDWADENYDTHCGLGWSSKDKGYQDGFVKYFKGDSMIITPPMFEQQDDLSATDFRKALENGESIQAFLPDGVSEEQIRKVLGA